LVVKKRLKVVLSNMKVPVAILIVLHLICLRGSRRSKLLLILRSYGLHRLLVLSIEILIVDLWISIIEIILPLVLLNLGFI